MDQYLPIFTLAVPGLLYTKLSLISSSTLAAKKSHSAVGLDELEHDFLIEKMEDRIKWARRNSVWPATSGLACCAIEIQSGRPTTTSAA